MTKKIFLISEFPDVNNPTSYSWIKTRVEALKDTYDISIVRILLNNKEGNQLTKIEHDGYTLYMLKVKALSIPKLRYIHSEILIKKILLDLMKKEKPDLIHVHFTIYFSWIIRDLANQLNTPYWITEHSSFFEESINRFYFGRKMKKALNGANQVFAVSTSLKSLIQQYTERDIVLKPNIVDIEHFLMKKRNRKERPYIYMVSVGSLDLNDKKGYELLVRALAEFKKENIAFRCDIIGKGPNRKKLEELIIKYQLMDNVQLLGSISNELLVDYYNDIDFFISSSRIETFGVAIIEAMSCGKPVLSTISGGPEEYITDTSGILIEKDSWRAIYEGIKEMSEKYRSFDGEKIRGFVVDNFSKETYVEKYNYLHDQLMNREKS